MKKLALTTLTLAVAATAYAVEEGGAGKAQMNDLMSAKKAEAQELRAAAAAEREDLRETRANFVSDLQDQREAAQEEMAQKREEFKAAMGNAETDEEREAIKAEAMAEKEEMKAAREEAKAERTSQAKGFISDRVGLAVGRVQALNERLEQIRSRMVDALATLESQGVDTQEVANALVEVEAQITEAQSALAGAQEIADQIAAEEDSELIRELIPGLKEGLKSAGAEAKEAGEGLRAAHTLLKEAVAEYQASASQSEEEEA